MTTKFIAAGNKEITDLNELVETLDNGKEVKIFVDDAMVTKVRVAKKPNENSKLKFSAQVLLHGVPARNLEQVASYVEGDAHDRSKVQFLSPGKGFKSFF